eukprot:gene27135-35046_t
MNSSVDYVQARIVQAAANKQREIRSKRFKASESSIDAGEVTSASEYQKMVNVYQSMSGKSADESSKWLV